MLYGHGLGICLVIPNAHVSVWAHCFHTMLASVSPVGRPSGDFLGILPFADGCYPWVYTGGTNFSQGLRGRIFTLSTHDFYLTSPITRTHLALRHTIGINALPYSHFLRCYAFSTSAPAFCGHISSRPVRELACLLSPQTVFHLHSLLVGPGFLDVA